MGDYGKLFDLEQQHRRQPDPATPATPAPAPHHDTTTSSPATPVDDATRPSRTGRTPSSPPKRHMTRHPFEIYQDQVESLRQLAAQERLQGGTGSMSQMVRDAIDRVIAERRSA